MKKMLLLLLMLGTALCRADSGNARFIQWTGEVQETAVEETGRLEVFDTPASGQASGQTFADRVAQRGKRFLWVPSEDPERGAGGARIPDAVLSADGSALILLETIGAPGGPFDTRIVILDIAAGKIIHVLRLGKMRCTRLLTIPESDEILLAAPQEDSAVIVRCSLQSGKIQARAAGKGFSDWMIADDQLFVKDAAKANVRVYRLPELQIQRETAALYPGGLLLSGTDGKLLNAVQVQPDNGSPAAADAPWVLEDLSRKKPRSRMERKQNVLPFPERFQPTAAISCNTLSVWMAEGGAAYLLNGRTFHRIADRVTGKGTLCPVDGTLFLGLQKEDRIGVFHPEKSTRMERTTNTGSISPKTRGEVWRIFPVMAEKSGVIVLDHRGGIYRLQPQPKAKKWRKTILFTPGE